MIRNMMQKMKPKYDSPTSLTKPKSDYQYCKPWNFRERFIFATFTNALSNGELKTHENFNSNALTIKFLQQMWNFVYC
jgi:hypothetical protein